MRKIGIIGQGFVGTAIREVFKEKCDVVTYDKKDGHTIYMYGPDTDANGLAADVEHAANFWEELLTQCFRDRIIFLCLPTPMHESGYCDIRIVKDMLSAIACYLPSATVVIKSTVPPGTTAKSQKEYPKLKLCFNPEFLTEANAVEDFRNQDRIILGGTPEAVKEVSMLYDEVFPHVMEEHTDPTTAEFVKYFSNVALATKVSLANELKQIADVLQIDYDRAASIAMLDKRLGMTHWDVPGPDGHLGFGGSCFPKDLNGLKFLSQELGVKTTMLDAVWQKNLEVRPEEDWKELKGRAVV
jgi:UDPglucose 6-dehydrogenase